MCIRDRYQRRVHGHPESLRVLSAFTQEIKHKFSDPFTELVLVLTESFDFEKITALLLRFSKAISEDYFLHKYLPELLENVQELIVNVHAKLFSRICVSDLAKITKLAPEKVISICEAKAASEGHKSSLSADKKVFEMLFIESDPTKRLEEYTTDLQIRAQILSEQPQSTSSLHHSQNCLLYTSPSPRDLSTSRMPSSA
eukprot:TRINITY_DN427_c0_g1_i2.p2 TRINITY_DN427_c0_g1~~TRINITY_DN427_c0_g1_i2.p2  ORF type:complete len:199 (-),score=26.98 TRINITY_DN427_c0_g1_i2:100-696(-)